MLVPRVQRASYIFFMTMTLKLLIWYCSSFIFTSGSMCVCTCVGAPRGQKRPWGAGSTEVKSYPVWVLETKLQLTESGHLAGAPSPQPLVLFSTLPCGSINFLDVWVFFLVSCHLAIECPLLSLSDLLPIFNLFVPASASWELPLTVSFRFSMRSVWKVLHFCV